MTQLDMTDLTTILRHCAGEGEAVNLDGDTLDMAFADLGYDSLAVLETTSRIERNYGVRLEDEVAAAETLRGFLDLVNDVLRQASE